MEKKKNSLKQVIPSSNNAENVNTIIITPVLIWLAPQWVASIIVKVT